MSNGWIKGRCYFECDACTETFEGDEDWIASWADARVAGWKAVRVGETGVGKNDWNHYCPAHASQFSKPDLKKVF